MSKFAEYIPDPERLPALSAADGLVIRPVLEADLEEVARIAAEREGEASAPWLVAFERFYEEKLAGRAVVLVAALPNEIAGYGKASHFAPAAGSPANVAPEGWYLTGVVVRPAYRRRGLGSELTRARLAGIAKRADKAYYFANELNRVTIELHRAFGFVELTRNFHHPGAKFEVGAGILYVCDLHAPSPGPGAGPR